LKHKTLTVVEIPLTNEEIQKCLENGKKRTEFDEEKLGWKYRHPGLPSPLAHAVGFMGETGFEKWLMSEGLKKDRDYVRGERFVERLEDIRQDYHVLCREVGIKTAQNDSLDEATKWGTFLYPAKKEVGEAKRVLPYPDYLVQAAVSQPKKKCWLCGYVDKETITQSPVRVIVGKPAHSISISKYRPVDELLKKLGWSH
jgi:hypothetical protein